MGANSHDNSHDARRVGGDALLALAKTSFEIGHFWDYARRRIEEWHARYTDGTEGDMPRAWGVPARAVGLAGRVVEWFMRM